MAITPAFIMTCLIGDDDELAEIWFRLTATEADETTLSAYGGLWTELESVSDVETAWQGTLTALFRDPSLLTY